MNILITGANGQLGNEMRIASLSLEEKGYHLFFTDINELDITEPESIDAFIHNHHINIIVNCAAYTAVDKAEDDAILCEKLNSEAPLNLAKAANKYNCRLIHVSTDYVFNGNHFIPYTEEDETSPDSIYGETKLKGEQNILKECNQSLIIRTAWLYSSFGYNFVKTMIKLGRERDHLSVIFDQIGTPTYAKDLANTICSIILNKPKTGIFHFSNEGVCSWYDFAQAIHEIAGIKNCKINPIHTSEYPTKANRPHYSVLDKTKIKHELGIEIPHWRESLKEAINKIIKK